MPILSHIYIVYIISWDIRVPWWMILFQGFICKCVTHFSPPAKKYKTSPSFLEYPSVKEILRVLCKEKETERSRLFALGFAGSKEGIEVFFNLHLFFTNGFRYGELNVLFNCVYLIPWDVLILDPCLYYPHKVF